MKDKNNTMKKTTIKKLKKMIKYNVTWEVDFDNGYKTIDNVVMAKDEKEAEKVSEKLLDKYLEKRAKQLDTGINEVELYSVKVYDSRTDGDIKVNSFSEYKRA
jgi:uncharacterized alpha/beta hydrolase family protein